MQELKLKIIKWSNFLLLIEMKWNIVCISIRYCLFIVFLDRYSWANIKSIKEVRLDVTFLKYLGKSNGLG